MHVDGCASCRREVEAFREASFELQDLAGEMPPELNWTRLAAEMKANIRVGLAAGECVGPAVRPAVFGWRPALAGSCIVVLVLASWWLIVPGPGALQNAAATRPGTVGSMVVGALAGVELQEKGRGMTLMHPGDRTVAFSVSLAGSARARYVDADSGQVTINHVYME
jgi:hypothetical protein